MSTAPRTTSKKCVLVVDDDHAALEAMETALEREFRVLRAPDIPTTNNLLNHETVDLVILDVRLDGESGLDFLAHLRETSDVPVLLISGYGTKDTLIEGLRSRASDYMDKPFSATQLQDRARMLIAQGPRPSHISERIQLFVQQNYMHDWTVESLAKALNLSVRTMRLVFRRRYRQSVMDFLEEVRLTRASELLAATDLEIQEVSAQVGFRDPHYFARVFRRVAAKSPRAFRADSRHDSGTATD